jgi:hypothetical protein
MTFSERVKQQINVNPEDMPSSTMIAGVSGAIGFGLTLFIYFGFQFVFHHLPTYQLISAMQGSSNTLCFAGMTSSATILPLMLTIFSFARNADVEFNHWFYKRVRTIAWFCCASFVVGLITLTLLSAPIGDMSQINDVVYNSLYYVVVGGLSVLVAILFAEIILLYYAIIHILRVLDPLE